MSTIAIRIKDVSIECKAMRHSYTIWYLTSKTIHREMFVLIVLFKDAHDALDGICIMVLVCLSVQIMERIWVSRYAIRKSEVDGDVHVDFTATEDVIQE